MRERVHSLIYAARRSFGRSLTVLFVLCAGSAALADQILELAADSLTSYLASATAIQDVRPRHSQRGVNIDGTLRAGGMFGLALEGNPFEPSLPGRETLNGVRLATGAASG